MSTPPPLRNAVVPVLIAVLLLAPTIIRWLPTEPRIEFYLSDTFDNEPVSLGALPDVCDGLADGKSVKIGVAGTIDKLVNYQNFFQTDNENRGIRVEVDESGAVALLVASDSPDGFDAVVAPTIISAGTVSLEFLITNGTELSVLANQQKETTNSSSLRPLCNNVVIGAGFDSSRTTLGSIVVTFTVVEEIPRFVPTFVVEGLNNSPLRTILLGLLTYSLLMATMNLSIYWQAKRASTSSEEEVQPERQAWDES